MVHNVDPQLSQWDVGRIVNISDSEATHIHFANQGDSKAVIIEIENGSAKIPDYLLQTSKTVIAYAVKDGVTLESKSFSVRKRERPENYVYEDDQRNYIYELITDAETAVVNANQATTNANTATESATIATTNANVATYNANLATAKANTATDNANLATQNVNEAVMKANNAVKNMMVVGVAEGESISLDNAIDQTLVGLRVFGKTTQNGTPTPDAPVELVSVGESGSITVNVNNTQSMTISTPNGLPGIPVTSGGNYTDAKGQQWICDEIDFAKSCLVRRIQRITFDQIDHVSRYEQPSGSGIYRFNMPPDKRNPIVSVRFSSNNIGMSNALQFDEGVLGHNVTDNCISTYANGGLYARCDSIVSEEEFLETAREEHWLVLSLLETPIEIPLSEEELAAYANLHTYKDNTTVSNDAGAWMDLEYVMDAKKYIDSLVAGGIAPARVE